MTEEQIERIVEMRIDAIDAAWATTNWTQTEYDRRIAAVDKWAELQLRHRTPAAT